MDIDRPRPGHDLLDRPVHDLVALLEPLDCHDPRWARDCTANAHLAMQRHRECLVGECATKTAAFVHLRDEGRLTPDAGRTR
ncbi:hypothetical protein [Nocardia bovistercoris]|uniref:Uncharacterized protein n=1 Tax=Nocardia bovistercoris TaxID=2785916 RepID=A0A931N1T1_9NOCA|nr:hypothetical protein [Nocardia bovistercoris]MBH0775266.1 hypothetical protein [Nocardia bovistercoris]